MSRILLVRHGETEGESSIRFHGAGDVALSELGREQMRRVRRALPDEAVDAVVASPLSRAWEGARIVLPGAPVLLEAGFREVDFGRWEGLTAEEIEALDPPLHREWREGPEDFRFPDGERRSDFRKRVVAGLERLLARRYRSPLVVAHKGVVRTITEHLTGEVLPAPDPALGSLVRLSRGGDGRWALSEVRRPG